MYAGSRTSHRGARHAYCVHGFGWTGRLLRCPSVPRAARTFTSLPAVSTCRPCVVKVCASKVPNPSTFLVSTRLTIRAEIGVVDFVMLCVKLWDTEAALQQIRPLVGAAPTIISFQNGVLKDQSLRAAYDDSQIMGGVGYVATTIDRPGVIRQTGPMQRLPVRRVRRLPIASRRRRCSQACLAGGIKAELSDEHPARDLAEVRFPGRAIGDDDDDSQADRSDPRASADSRVLARRDARGRRRRPRARCGPGRRLRRGSPASSPTTWPMT